MMLHTLLPLAKQFDIANQYLLKDEFTDTLPAGSTNGTFATDGVNLRTDIDTNNKLSQSDGHLVYTTGEFGNGNPSRRYPSWARVRGLAVIAALLDTAAGASYMGWDTNTSGLNDMGGNLNNTAISVVRAAGLNIAVGTHTPNAIHYLASICRTTGQLFFGRGGIYPHWMLMYVNPLSTATPLYPALANGGTTHVGFVDFIYIPKDLILFSPIASDSFNRANGVLGNSDAAGSEETAQTTPAWTDVLGTGAIVTNVAKMTALSGGIGISVLEINSADVFCEVVATRTGGNTGMCLRYTDANNYITCHHNGTNIQAIEVVAGTPNTLINAAATYAASARMTLSLEGAKVRAFYNAAAVGTEATTAVLTGTKHGVYTTDVNATFNDFACWAKGTSGEYDILTQYTDNTDINLYFAPNAVSPLTTPTYEGSGEAVHPDVWDAGIGLWNGYRYWMVMTPFPGGDATKENPSILASNDKLTWVVPPGLTNPIAGPPGSGFYADPDITVDNGVMYVIFKHQTLVKETHSSDGITWSAPTTINTVSVENNLVSPSVIWDGAQYVMFSVNAVGFGVIEKRTCPTLTGIWSAPTACSLGGSAIDPWHIDVIKVEGKLVMFVNASSQGWYAESLDGGLNWNVGTVAVLKIAGTPWDQNIYRGTILPNSTGYDLWYSAVKYAANPDEWHIGYTTIIC